MTRSERIYRILLRVYPVSFRREYGEPMAHLFRDQLRQATGWRKLIHLWGRTIADLLKTAPAYHVREMLAIAVAILVIPAIPLSVRHFGRLSGMPAHWQDLPLWEVMAYRTAIVTGFDALTLLMAFSFFLLLMKRFSLRSLLRGWLLSLPVLAAGRIGVTFLGLLYPPHVVGYMGFWLPVFSGLLLSMWTTGRISGRAFSNGGKLES